MARQFCTRAHTENALAMGPKVPCTKDKCDFEGDVVEDSRVLISYREERKSC